MLLPYWKYSTYSDVGSKYSNTLDLYDMTGNVWEWLSDWNNNVPSGSWTDPYCVNTDNVTDYSSMTYSSGGVLIKGGSWDSKDDGRLQNDENSYKNSPQTKDDYTGFRLCRNVNY